MSPVYPLRTFGALLASVSIVLQANQVQGQSVPPPPAVPTSIAECSSYYERAKQSIQPLANRAKALGAEKFPYECYFNTGTPNGCYQTRIVPLREEAKQLWREYSNQSQIAAANRQACVSQVRAHQEARRSEERTTRQVATTREQLIPIERPGSKKQADQANRTRISQGLFEDRISRLRAKHSKTVQDQVKDQLFTALFGSSGAALQKHYDAASGAYRTGKGLSDALTVLADPNASWAAKSRAIFSLSGMANTSLNRHGLSRELTGMHLRHINLIAEATIADLGSALAGFSDQETAGTASASSSLARAIYGGASRSVDSSGSGAIRSEIDALVAGLKAERQSASARAVSEARRAAQRQRAQRQKTNRSKQANTSVHTPSERGGSQGGTSQQSAATCRSIQQSARNRAQQYGWHPDPYTRISHAEAKAQIFDSAAGELYSANCSTSEASQFERMANSARDEAHAARRELDEQRYREELERRQREMARKQEMQNTINNMTNTIIQGTIGNQGGSGSSIYIPGRSNCVDPDGGGGITCTVD